MREVVKDETKPLTREEEHTVALRAKKGDKEARDQLIMANTRFITSVALHYMGHGATLEDLVQGGVLGLLTALEGFDPKRPTRLLTYANWRIRRGIMAVAKAHSSTMKTGVLDEPMEDGESDEDGNAVLHLRDCIRDDSQAPDEAVHDQDTTDKMQALMGDLRGRERKILMMRFGMEKGKKNSFAASFKQIGLKFGISRERARQIVSRRLRLWREELGSGDSW